MFLDSSEYPNYIIPSFRDINLKRLSYLRRNLSLTINFTIIFNFFLVLVTFLSLLFLF